MEDYVDFEKKFKKLTEQHKKDSNYGLIKDYPAILSTVMEIASDKNSDPFTKIIMNCAISYFVIPTDVLSEKEQGIKGYLDDFFICICALRELLEYDENLGKYLIKKHWNLEEEYDSYIVKTYYELTKKIDSKLVSDIFDYSGMDFVEKQIDMKNKPKRYSEQKIRDLQTKIHYLFFLFLNRPLVGKEEKRKFEEQVFGTEEFREFAKKMELLSKTDKTFARAKDNLNEMLSIEEKMKKIKARRLLK